jgi:putative transposase
MGWLLRYVLSWGLSKTLDAGFCIEALWAALEGRRPRIFNTDQGSQFTSEAFTGVLLGALVQILMDGRVLENVFVELLWRTVKYEHVYLRAAEDGQ